jgi:hypothetical protein
MNASRHRAKHTERMRVGLGLSIALWVLVLAGVASITWVMFGTANVFKWNDEADRVQYALLTAGGVGAVAALVISYRKQKLAEDSVILDLESHYGGRFVEATNQLGSQNPTIRMAGALSLVHLADDWLSQRQTVIDVLTSYLRMPTTSGEAAEKEIRASIFRSIRDHLRPSSSSQWHRATFDFTGAELAGSDFTDITITPQTILKFAGASFTDTIVQFSGNLGLGSLIFDGITITNSAVRFNSDINLRLLSFEAANIVSGSLDFSGTLIAGERVSFAGVTVAAGKISTSQPCTFTKMARYSWTTAKLLRATSASSAQSWLGRITLSEKLSFQEGSSFTTVHDSQVVSLTLPEPSSPDRG